MGEEMNPFLFIIMWRFVGIILFGGSIGRQS